MWMWLPSPGRCAPSGAGCNCGVSSTSPSSSPSLGYSCPNPVFGQPADDPQPVLDFLTATFDFLRTEKECSLGMPGDGCRLVQGWNWYSLDHTSDFNPHHYLVNPQSRTLTPTGEAYRAYVERYAEELK